MSKSLEVLKLANNRQNRTTSISNNQPLYKVQDLNTSPDSHLNHTKQPAKRMDFDSSITERSPGPCAYTPVIPPKNNCMVVMTDTKPLSYIAILEG